MLKNGYRYFLYHPERAVLWGFRISVAGIMLLCCGLLARLWMIIKGNAGKTSGKTLDALLPYFPTWWIPETWFGYLFALMLMLVGLMAYGVGKRVAAMSKIGADKTSIRVS